MKRKSLKGGQDDEAPKNEGDLPSMFASKSKKGKQAKASGTTPPQLLPKPVGEMGESEKKQWWAKLKDAAWRYK